MIWVSGSPGIWESDVNATLLRYLLMFLLLMPAAIVHAQQQTDEPEPAEQQTESSGDEDTTGEQVDGSSDSDLPDIDSQPIDNSQSAGPGRFIPSEQISQDFGVSFPVDI